MRDQKQTSVSSLQLQRCHCASAFGCLVLGGACALPFCCHMKQISLWHARVQEFTAAAVKSQAPKTTTPPSTTTPPAATWPLTSLVSVIISEFQISNIAEADFLVLNYNNAARSYWVSPWCQPCDSYPVTLECTDDFALWSSLTRFSQP